MFAVPSRFSSQEVLAARWLRLSQNPTGDDLAELVREGFGARSLIGMGVARLVLDTLITEGGAAGPSREQCNAAARWFAVLADFSHRGDDYQRLRARVVRAVGSADDLVEPVFNRVLHKLYTGCRLSYWGPRYRRSWSHIIRSAMIDELRSSRRFQDQSHRVEAVANPGKSSAPACSDPELGLAVARSFARLERELEAEGRSEDLLLWLRYLGESDFDHQRIGEQLEVRDPTSRQGGRKRSYRLVHELRQRLRALLADELGPGHLT